MLGFTRVVVILDFSISLVYFHHGILSQTRSTQPTDYKSDTDRIVFHPPKVAVTPFASPLIASDSIDFLIAIPPSKK